MHAGSVVPAAAPGGQAQNSGEKRDDVASPRLVTTPARGNGHENRGPTSERAGVIVDVGADRGFAVAATVGRGRLAGAGAAGGSIATTVRHELDVVRDDLGEMPLLAV